MMLYFCISLCFIIYSKRKVLLEDSFILGTYNFLIYIFSFLSYYLYYPFLSVINYEVFYILVGLTSKVFLIIFTYYMIRKIKFRLFVPNKKYMLIMITEIIILIIFVIQAYSITNVKGHVNIQDNYYIFFSCILLAVVFVLIIVNGLFFNKIYSEKLQYEKQIQKSIYVKQSLMLINSMNYDIEKKEHRLYWILEKVKKLNNHKIEDIDNEINKFQLEISNMNNKIIQSKNIIFDTMISLKISELSDEGITLKTFFEIDKNEIFDDLEFINIVINILNHIKRNNDVTMNIKDKGIYIVIELFSINYFYSFDDFSYTSSLIIDKNQFYKNNIHHVKFLIEVDNNHNEK